MIDIKAASVDVVYAHTIVNIIQCIYIDYIPMTTSLYMSTAVMIQCNVTFGLIQLLISAKWILSTKSKKNNVYLFVVMHWLSYSYQSASIINFSN